jgi:hypothetical protein
MLSLAVAYLIARTIRGPLSLITDRMTALTSSSRPAEPIEFTQL